MKTTIASGITAVALFAGFSGVSYADWRYAETTDPMTSKTVKTAQVDSEGSLSLDFPYRGENRGHLFVRKDSAGAVNVIVAIDKGQIICNSYEGCHVTIRFDDRPPVKFTAIGPADHSSTVLFLNNEQRFISSAKSAKRILIQLTLYRNGSQVLEFATAKSLLWGVSARAKNGSLGARTTKSSGHAHTADPPK